MQWLEIRLDTRPDTIDAITAALTAKGFSDLVIEDQQEFEDFLDQNRACWDYIDEELQQKLQGLSCIKLYLEEVDTAGMERLEALVAKLQQQPKTKELTMTVQPLAETNWEESWGG